jgi:DNA repair ATPase RecN
MNRLTLKHLTFIGAGVEPASVEFGPGTTVVRGPSDTGKSFIVDAIDFMLGATTLNSSTGGVLQGSARPNLGLSCGIDLILQWVC